MKTFKKIMLNILIEKVLIKNKEKKENMLNLMKEV